MAYKLKYIADVKRARLNIYQKDYTGDTMILATLSALAVGYTGNQSVEAPIIKSELNFSLVDAFMHEAVYDDQEQMWLKFGRFEEFYTSDATRYLVELQDPDGTVRWQGYLTPDSYTEELVYGGTVTFVARDMIGHLADFEFDYHTDSGMAAIGELLEVMSSKADIAMTIDTSELAKLVAKVSDDGTETAATEWLVCLNAFEDMTWYDVIEAILDSIGCTMRWTDGNVIAVTPLRYLDDGLTEGAVQFVSAGTRTMSPAVRRIVETFNYMTGVPVFEQESQEGDYTAKTLIPGDYGISVPTFVPSASSQWTAVGIVDTYDYLSTAESWISKDSDKLMMSVLGKVKKKRTYNGYISKSMTLSGASANLALSFSVDQYLASAHDYANGDAGLWFVRLASMVNDIGPDNPLTVYVNWAVVVKVGSTTNYLTDTGGWQTAEVVNSSTGSIDVPIALPAGSKTLELRIYGFTAEVASGSTNEWHLRNHACFGFLSGLRVEAGNSYASGKFVTTTIYNDKNNVILERSPKLGQTPAMPMPGIYPNGFYRNDSDAGYPAFQLFGFSGDDEYSRLSVLVHRQLLCFYDKPNSELSGELIEQSTGLPSFGMVWNWEGARHLLCGGKLNLLTGRVDTSVVREYTRYDDLWSGLRVSPTLVECGASGDVVTLTVTATSGQEWNVLGLPSWITADKTSGNGTTSIALSIASNPDYTAREAVVSVAGTQVTVRQAAKSPTSPEWTASDTAIDYEEQDIDISVEANGNVLTFGTGASWLTVYNTIGGIYVTASENTTTSSRSATVTMSWPGGTRSVTITQDGQPTSDPAWDAVDKVIDETAQTVAYISVQRHGNTVTMTSSASWLTLAQDGDVYTVTAKANAGTEVRTATVTMSWTGGSLSVTVTQAAPGQARPVWNAKDLYLDASAQTAGSVIVRDAGYNVTVSASQSWVSVTLESGIYVIAVEANSSQDARSAILTMSWDDGSASVIISQSGDTGNTPSWNAQDTSITGDAQDVMTIIVNENGNTVTLSRNQAWLTITKTSTSYKITATENRTGATRTGRITMTWSGGSKYVTVTQLPKTLAPPVWSAEDTTIDRREQEAMTIIVKPNGYDFTIGSDVDWLTVTSKAGIYIVTASENTGKESRTGIITLDYGDGTMAVTVTQLPKSVMQPVWTAEDMSVGPKAQDVQTFAVRDNGYSINFETSDSWIMVEDLSGLWRISVTENTSSAIRVGTVTMVWEDGSTSVTIAQARKDAANPIWDAESKSVDSSAQRVETISVQDNGTPVTITSSESWLTVTEEESGIYAVNVSANESENTRTGRVTMTWSGGSKYVTVYQHGVEAQMVMVWLETVSPADAEVIIDGVTVASGSYVAVKAGTAITITATANGYRPFSQTLTVYEDTYLDIVLEDITAEYKVSINLTNCWASNLATKVYEGGTYVNTITPDEGYAIGNLIVIQMGYTNLTDVYTYNADGTLSIVINNVTGNIGISIIAQ